MSEKYFNVEKGFISKLLETKDMPTVKDSQISVYFFTGENKRIFQFIVDSYKEDGEVPTLRVLQRKFPDFIPDTYTVNSEEIVGTEESLKFWCNELRKKAKHNSLVQSVEEVIGRLENFDTDTAFDLIKREIAHIESDIEEQSSCDITKNTEDRVQAYLKRKENRGMLGLSYGLNHLDYITKGLEKETLTTLIAQTGTGKALTLDTPILTLNGFVPMGDIKVGTKVFARDGKAYPVSAVYPQGEKAVYRVTFEDGTYVDCCSEHLWVYKTTDDVCRKNNWRVSTLDYIMKHHPIKRGKSFNIGIPVSMPVHFEGKKELPIDPYVLGALLGDGGFTTDRISFTSIDDELVNEINNRLISFNGSFVKSGSKNLQYLFKSNTFKENKLYRAIDNLGLKGTNSHTKFIPSVYLTSSIENRLELVRGLIDTDGTVTKRGFVKYFTSSKQLRDDFVYLIRSLGYRCRIHSYHRRNGSVEYSVFVSSKNAELFSSSHRKEQYAKSYKSVRENHYDLLKIVDICPLGYSKEMQCITVDSPDHTFICGDFIVTHNTWFEVLIGAYCMLQNCKVLQLVTEMSEDIMRDRYEAMLYSMMYGEFDYSAFKSGTLTLEQEKQYFEFLENDLPECEPLIIATATGVMGVAAEIEKHKPDIVLIDGVYLMEDDQGAKDDWLRVAHITRDLKKLAKRSKIPIFINTQADKNTSKKTGPELGSIMYTQAIGQDSDCILALYRDEVMMADREMCVKVLKQREGVTGKVTMNWDFSTMNFDEIYSDAKVEEDIDEEGNNVIGVENVD